MGGIPNLAAVFDLWLDFCWGHVCLFGDMFVCLPVTTTTSAFGTGGNSH